MMEDLRGASRDESERASATERVEIQPGFELLLSRYQTGTARTLHVKVDRPMFSFGCIEEGRMEIAGIVGDVVLREGMGINMWASEGRYSFKVVPGMYRSLSLEVSADFLADRIIGPDFPSLQVLERALAKPSFPLFFRTQPLSSISQLASAALLNSPADVPFRSLFLESHALTILREQLMNVVPQNTTTKKDLALGRKDIDRLEEVRRLLVNSPEQSPSLFELAARAGMNECTMKRNFRTRFGMTVYEYLRRHRMRIADGMLRAGYCTISETATAVGYKSAGRFAMAFRREFGISPKKRQMIVRGRTEPPRAESAVGAFPN